MAAGASRRAPPRAETPHRAAAASGAATGLNHGNLNADNAPEGPHFRLPRRTEAFLSEPARERPSRSNAHDELEAILREAEAARRGDPLDIEGADDAPARPVTPEPSRPRVVALPPTDERGIKFESPIRIEDPGELKIRTFRFSPRAIVAMALGVVTLVVWMMSPHGADQFRSASLPGSYTEASSRFAMVLTAARIDRFRAERSRLPAGLDELGPVATDLIAYTRLSDTEYRLEAPGMNHSLVLDGTTTRDRFLGLSLDELRRQPDAP